MDLTLTPPTKQSLEAETARWSVQAKSLPPIVDADSCTAASYLLRSIKGLRADIANWFAPHLDAAMETKRKAEAARKGLADERDRMEAPLVAIENQVKRALLTWETTQEQIRREQERALQAESQRLAEAATLEAAAALELEATATGDAAMLQEAHDILDEPTIAPVVSVAKLTPKVQGIVYRDNWRAHNDVDVKQLARAVAEGRAPSSFLTVNITALNNFARATKGLQAVDGVQFFNDRQIATRG